MAAEAGAQGQVAASRRNVELKATDPSPVRSLAICHELEAEDLGLLHQRDTYFHAPRGRLKLREEYGRAWLIPYDRPDAAEARLSRCRLIDAPDPRALREGLEATLGPHVVVEKERRLFLWRGVRIHLDTVVGLGAFIEFEAVVEADFDLVVERARVERLRTAFGIRPDRVVAAGYADLLLSESADSKRESMLGGAAC